MHAQTPAWAGYLTAAVIVLVLVLRLRGMRQARRLNLNTLWIVPVIFGALIASVIATTPPHGLQWLGMAVALAIGAAFGWRRGKLMRISLDPETGTLNQQASPAAFLFILVLLVARQALRYEAGSFGFNVALVTDLLMAFALGLITASRVEIYLRAKQLLAGKPA
jgi:hypothetical protein